MSGKNSKLVYSTDPGIKKKIDEEKKSSHNTQSVDLPPSQQNIKILLEKKGRKGKTVTVINNFQHSQKTLSDLARKLKQHCGSGGTAKDHTIEIQGDKRAQVEKKLLALGYRTRSY